MTSADGVPRPMPDEALVRPATHVRTVDGDTLVCQVWLTLGVILERHVRLARIDAPELPTPAGEQARAFVDAYARGTALRMQLLGQDKYGRLLAEIWRVSDGSNLSDVLLAGGYARPYAHLPMEIMPL